MVTGMLKTEGGSWEGKTEGYQVAESGEGGVGGQSQWDGWRK